MSMAHRQKTCAACGGPILESERVSVEPLIDGQIRYVVVHWNHHTFSCRKATR